MNEEHIELDEVENFKKEVFSKSVKASKRKYFFDVKKSRGNNGFYLSIVESKRRLGEDGTLVYEKHKILLYKEDIEMFIQGLNEATEFINTHKEPEACMAEVEKAEADSAEAYTVPNFEDL